MKTSALFIGTCATFVYLSCGLTVSAQEKRETIARSAMTGERTKLGENFHIKNDCSADGVPAIHVLQRPLRGKAEIAHEKIFPRPGPELAKCRSVKVAGVVLYYTPKKDYHGTDKVIISTAAGDGIVDTVTINISVVN